MNYSRHSTGSAHRLGPVGASLFDQLVRELLKCRRQRQPSALAVLRLIMNSNFMGCSTGMSGGLAHLRIFACLCKIKPKLRDFSAKLQSGHTCQITDTRSQYDARSL
jgi:hypothetical protein